MPADRKVRKPWPMKWIVASILVFIPIYTYLTLHYRRPGPAFNPYGDMRDRADVIRHRLRVYAETTGQLVPYYTERGILVSVDADQPPDSVTADIQSRLSALPFPAS